MKITTPLFIFLLFLVTACNEQASSQDSSEATEQKESVAEAQTPEKSELASVEVEEFLQRMMDDDVALLLDVRTPEERVTEGFIAPEGIETVNWDFSGPDFQEQLKSVSPDQHIYIYCHSGRRSALAGNILVGNGVKEVYNLLGGIVGWGAAGKEIKFP